MIIPGRTDVSPSADREDEGSPVAEAICLSRCEPLPTDRGCRLTTLPHNSTGWLVCMGPHMFDQVCIANGIEHKLTKTKPYHAWTNG